MAFDLFLPNDVYLIISQDSYEFKNKNGIAEALSDHMSVSRMSDFTDTSTLMAGLKKSRHETPIRPKKRQLEISNT